MDGVVWVLGHLLFWRLETYRFKLKGEKLAPQALGASSERGSEFTRPTFNIPSILQPIKNSTPELQQNPKPIGPNAPGPGPDASLLSPLRLNTEVLRSRA